MGVRPRIQSVDASDPAAVSAVLALTRPGPPVQQVSQPAPEESLGAVVEVRAVHTSPDLSSGPVEVTSRVPVRVRKGVHERLAAAFYLAKARKVDGFTDYRGLGSWLAVVVEQALVELEQQLDKQ